MALLQMKKVPKFIAICIEANLIYEWELGVGMECVGVCRVVDMLYDMRPGCCTNCGVLYCGVLIWTQMVNWEVGDCFSCKGAEFNTIT